MNKAAVISYLLACEVLAYTCTLVVYQKYLHLVPGDRYPGTTVLVTGTQSSEKYQGTGNVSRLIIDSQVIFCQFNH